MHIDQVRRFYAKIWNRRDLDVIPELLHEDITFRGSLGRESRGRDGFATYVNMVHETLGAYECVIEELIAQDEKVVAKMMFTGIHRAEFLGYAPTNRRVRRAGCAIFTFRGERMADIWVLGDLKGLEEQLKSSQQTP